MAAGGNEVEIVVKTRDQTAQGASKARESFRSIDREAGRSAGGFHRFGEAADTADTRAMGFRDTLTGVEDSFRGYSILSGKGRRESELLERRIASLQGQMKDTGGTEAQKAELEDLQSQLAITKSRSGTTFQGLLMLGMGIGDLGSGIFNFLVPALKAMSLGMLKTAAGTVASTAATVAHRAVSIASAAATGVMTAAQWALNAAMSANPIGLVILAIVALVAIVVIAYKRSETFRNIVQAAFRAVLGAARALGSGAVAAFNALVAGGGRIISFFRALPGRIISFLASLPGRMLELGQGIIQRLIDGIMSRVAAVGNAIGSIAQKVRNFLPFSPAKEGPLSGSGDPFKAGQHISDMLAGGIASRRGGIGGAMGGALAPAGGGRGGGPGSGPLVLHINIGGRQLAEVLVDPLRKSIRTRGGDVQVVLGS